MFSLRKKWLLHQQISSKKDKRAKKLVTILVISTPVIVTRKKGVENVDDGKNLGTTAGTAKDSENLRPNIVQVLFI